jgi:hypothetical protein
MPTSAKTKKSRPGTNRKGVRALMPGRRPSAPGRHSAPPRSHGLVGRVQTILPRAGRDTKTSPVQRVAGALARTTGGTTARTPVTKSMLGVVAGGVGVGAVAVAKRRHSTHANPLSQTASVPAVQAGSEDEAQTIETVTDPSATTGGDHGDPQGRDPATAA